jgi:hypothetical protein
MQTFVVTGAKASSGIFEDPKTGKQTPYDSTVVYVQAMMDPSKPNMAGFSTVEYKWGLSKNFDKIKDLDFPFEASLHFNTVTNGRTQSVVLTDVNPI